jgi:hypothetical protein
MLKPNFVPKVFDLEFLVDPQIRRCCGPIFFARSLDADLAENVAANGSFGLVDTGKRKLLVTCQHVWEAFDAAKIQHPAMRLCICLSSNSIVTLHPVQPIDQDETLDLASFDMEPFLDQCAESTFVPFDCDKVPPVCKGDALAFVGFPGHVVAQTSIGAKFNRTLHATFAYDVTDRCVVSDVRRLKPKEKKRSTEQDADYGGISGSPCFVVRQNLSLDLVAFATSHGLSVLRFTLARYLNADGTLKKGLCYGYS